jgi:hypothetical protein
MQIHVDIPNIVHYMLLLLNAQYEDSMLLISHKT